MAEQNADNSLAKISQQFTDIAKDLFNIEVNLILRSSIAGQKMPGPRHALLDIGKEYCAALSEMEIWRQDHLLKMGETAIGYNVDMFEAKRREMGYFTQTEAAVKAEIDPNDYDRMVSHDVSEELGGFDAFDVLRNWANSFLKDLAKESYLSPEQLAVLPRIKDNADLLKGIFSALCLRDPVLNDPQLAGSENLAIQLRSMAEKERTPNKVVKLSKQLNRERTIDLTNEYNRADLVTRDNIKPLPLREQDLVLIRKVWELGTEVIAMQTIIQLDGDVITRINPSFMNETRYPKLQSYHNQALAVALEHWSDLVTVAKELIVSAARGISDRLAA
jgi:hypothetical protein